MYLDVDGCILRHPDTPMFASRAEFELWWKANPGGGPANGVREFLEWATAHCEVRWLTAWAACGDLGDEGRTVLARRLQIPVELLVPVFNPRQWGFRADGPGKCDGIDWAEHEAGRPWAWLDDEILSNEREYLMGRRAFKNFIRCDSSKNANALVFALEALKRRFDMEDV